MDKISFQLVKKRHNANTILEGLNSKTQVQEIHAIVLDPKKIPTGTDGGWIVDDILLSELADQGIKDRFFNEYQLVAIKKSDIKQL